MATLEELLGSKTKIAVLRKLCSRLNADFTITELADELKIDKSAVSKTISMLENHGIVNTFQRGNLKLCRINDRSDMFDVISSVFTREEYLNA
jgi:DNA-binding transcriptional ArsR family regulator